MVKTAVSASVIERRAARAPTFFGEPRALAYLAFTEAWERFSYYGMTALLVLYLTQSLLLPGHVERIVGFGPFRAGLEVVFGPMSLLGLGSQIVGLYTGLMYFTPIFGGLIADRWLGHRRAVLLGALLMSAGHLAMAFDQSFLAAAGLLIVGCGFLKGNISTQVGELYDEADGAGRTRGFNVFSVGINVGAVAGPLVCGLLAQLYGWHAGFGLAGLLMLIGLGTYLAGYRLYPPDRPRTRSGRSASAPLDRRQRRVVAALIVVAAITLFQSIAYYQNGNVNLVWIDQKVDLSILGFHVPVAWFNSIDSLVSILAVPFLLALWRMQAARAGEPDDLAKIGIGAGIAAAANLLLVAGCLTSDPVPVLIPIGYDVLLGVAFLYYWPTLLALISRTAPASVRATLMGAVFLSIFVANFAVGWLGGFYEFMSPAAFWTMHAGIAAIGGILAFGARRPLLAMLAIP